MLQLSDSHSDSSDSDDTVALLSLFQAIHRLRTHRYNSLEHLERELTEYAAKALFGVAGGRSSNKVECFGPTKITFVC